MKSHSRGWVACAALITACGSGSSGTGSSTGGTSGGASGPLDCAWLASNNCYKTTLAAALSCVPPTMALGVLNGTGTVCAYDGGDTIAFATALTYPVPQSLALSYTVSQPDGGVCLSYTELPNSGGFTLKTAAGTLKETNTTASATVSCPDGTSFSNGNALALINCDGGFLSFPGQAYSYSPSTGDAGSPLGSISASLTGTADGQPAPVFACFSGA